MKGRKVQLGGVYLTLNAPSYIFVPDTIIRVTKINVMSPEWVYYKYLLGAGNLNGGAFVQNREDFLAATRQLFDENEEDHKLIIDMSNIDCNHSNVFEDMLAFREKCRRKRMLRPV